MNKSDLIKALAIEANLTQDQASRALDSFQNIVGHALISGKEVKLVGFGTFKTSKRKARTGRNPKTGKAIDIPAKTAVSFTAGKALKEAVN